MIRFIKQPVTSKLFIKVKSVISKAPIVFFGPFVLLQLPQLNVKTISHEDARTYFQDLEDTLLWQLWLPKLSSALTVAFAFSWLAPPLLIELHASSTCFACFSLLYTKECSLTADLFHLGSHITLCHRYKTEQIKTFKLETCIRCNCLKCLGKRPCLSN